MTGEVTAIRGQQWDLANMTGEVTAVRTKRMKLPKTANFFTASQINLRTLSMKLYQSPCESIKISLGEVSWGETSVFQRYGKKELSLELQVRTSVWCISRQEQTASGTLFHKLSQVFIIYYSYQQLHIYI